MRYLYLFIYYQHIVLNKEELSKINFLYFIDNKNFNLLRLKTFLSLGLVVISIFFVIWIPVLKHDPIAVIKRLFPFERGLYEVKFSL
jgi:hypothetical protein